MSLDPAALKARLRRTFRSHPLLRPLRKLRLAHEARYDAHVDWERLLPPDQSERLRALRAEASGPRILIATDVGLHFGASRLDSVLAAALALRGARVDVLLCDAALPACMATERSWYPDISRFVARGPQADLCSICFAPARDAWRTMGIEPLKLSSRLTGADRNEAKTLAAELVTAKADMLRAHPVGEHALAGALRFYARSTLEDTAEARGVLLAYLEASMLAGRSAERLFAETAYDVAVLHHGIYVPQGPVLAAARAAGVRVVSWNPGYRKRCFIFSHGDSYHRTMISEPTENWETLALSPEWKAATRDYLESRRRGEHDWIVFGQRPAVAADEWMRANGMDPAKPTALAATNVAWDAQIHYETNCFASMNDWLRETVSWFARHPDRQLIVRIHPAEITGNLPSREPAAQFLKDLFPDWPRNVFVVGPEEPVSTYDLAKRCHAAIIFATKLGIELAATGKPVIVAGEAWIRGKGFSHDARDPDHYRDLLSSFASFPALDAQQTDRALRYAFHYFFRRMIPIGVMRPSPGWPPYVVAVKSLVEIEAGADPGLDRICDSILSGSPFHIGSETADPGTVLGREAAA